MAKLKPASAAGISTERALQLTDDALSLDVLLREYTDAERRHVLSKLSAMFCKHCWRMLAKGFECECDDRALEVLSLVHERPGTRFQVGQVGESLMFVLGRLCSCVETLPGGARRKQELISVSAALTHTECHLRIGTFSAVLRLLSDKLNALDKSAHPHKL